MKLRLNFYWLEIHLCLKCIKKNNQDSLRALAQVARDVLGTSPEGVLNVLTSGTFKGPSGDS